MKNLSELKFIDSIHYSKEHTWARVEGELVIVGISDYAQDQLGDIIFVDLPEPGDTYAFDDVFGNVESVKTASDLYMPVGGEIVAINVDLDNTPELINSAPYDDGWMIKVKPHDYAELETLLDAASYRNSLE